MSSLKNKWFKFLKWSAIFGAILALIGCIVATVLYQIYVVNNPGDHLSKASIIQALGKESAVLYRDGETQMHAFYDKQHRIYVTYDQIPKDWVNAITASEDQRFFTHHGLDPKGIARAMLSNIKAGRIVSGGSTITQQTAKNVFNRPDRSLQSKLNEAVNALRLEHLYSKEEILEFYANQFHVSSNGRGIGVAARHYFNKSASELSLIECAFIAGMLQGPNLYDPFISRAHKGRTLQESRERNLERAHARVQYVLDRMHAEGHISTSLYNSVKDQEIPFQRGMFQFSSNTIVDEVRERLQKPPLSDVLEEFNIDNPSTAGLRIVTTIDQDIHRHAQYGLVHHLTEVGSILEGVSPEDLTTFSELKVIQEKRGERNVGDLFYATVQAHDKNGTTVSDGNGSCLVDTSGLKRITTILHKAKNTKWGQSISQLQSKIPVGSIVWVSVRGIENDAQICDIEIPVDLQGGVVALHKGEVLSMVGGTQNIDFNRALDAERQFGSTWKALIYTAALQLGWSPLDLLDNRGNPFPFERVWYYPRSGHRDAEPFPNLVWTGVQSENRASVWLLTHLTDRLSSSEMMAVANKVGLVQGDDEGETAYMQRIRDGLGVISTTGMRAELAFYAAKKQLLRSEMDNLLIEDWTEIDEVRFRSMLYGTGARAELENQTDPENRSLTQLNYLTLMTTNELCQKERSSLSEVQFDSENSVDTEAINLSSSLLFWSPSTQRVYCGSNQPFWLNDLEPVDGHNVEWALLAKQEWWLDGAIPTALFQMLEQRISIETTLLQGLHPYALQYLQHHPDFVQIVNMRYINYLLNNLGIEGTLPLTLTLPLGAVEIDLIDTAMLYNGLLTGQRTQIDDDFQNGNVLIQRIEDSEGTILFEAKPKTTQVSNYVSGVLLSNILHNVVAHGTGRRAKGITTQDGVVIPVLGKTGTTNGYKNAAFVGMVPKAEAGQWSVENGVTIATYVGYDQPKSMKFGNLKLSGASGALPVWMETVKGVGLSDFIGQPRTGMNFSVPEDFGFHTVSVDAKTGMVTEEGTADIWIYDPNAMWGQEGHHVRAFSPVDANEVPGWLAIHGASTTNQLSEDESIEDVRVIPSVPSEGEHNSIDVQEDSGILEERIVPQ